MITYPCPQCGETLAASEAKVGAALVCGLCGTSSTVPGARGAAVRPTGGARKRLAELALLQTSRPLGADEWRECAAFYREAGDEASAARSEAAAKSAGGPAVAPTGRLPDYDPTAMATTDRQMARLAAALCVLFAIASWFVGLLSFVAAALGWAALTESRRRGPQVGTMVLALLGLLTALLPLMLQVVGLVRLALPVI